MTDTELKKVPFIYKGTEKYSKQVKIASVFTSDKTTVTIPRLKYLIDTGKIELLNARVTDDGNVEYTDEFKMIKQNIDQLRDFWECLIDSPDILTPEQRQMAAILEGTPLEIDIDQTSRCEYDTAVSKPFVVSDDGHYIIVYMQVYPWFDNGVRGVVQVYDKNLKHILNIDLRNASNDLINESIRLLGYLSDKFMETACYEKWAYLISEILEEYLCNTPYVIDCKNIDPIHCICEHFHIKERYSGILQTRIDDVKKQTDAIIKLAEIAKDRHGLEQPDLETMILCFAFPRADSNVDWEMKIFRNEHGDYIKEHATERALKTYHMATEFAKNQKLTELFGLIL